MSLNNHQNNQIYLTKEVFIQHIRDDIEQLYQINEQCIGQGGFGQVFEAKKKRKIQDKQNEDYLANSFSTEVNSQNDSQNQHNNNQFRAIKVIQYEKNISKQDKQRLTNEIEILSYLDHPSIVKLYETIQSKKLLYLVTDLLKGGDLAHITENKKLFSENDIKYIFKQIIQALNYLHSQNICHRDLKPENILFLDEKSLNIALIDFGLAFIWQNDMRKELKKTGQDKKLIGTPEYMSPEMIARNYNEKSDIWAAGVILYELLTKISPFCGQNNQQTMNNVKNLNFSLEIPELKKFSEEAKDLISKILAPEDQRISLIGILQHPWFNEDHYSYSVCSSDQTSTMSMFCIRKPLQQSENEKRQNKFKTVKSEQRMRKVPCTGFDKQSDLESENGDCYSELVYFETKFEQLTVEKIQCYCMLSKFQKLMCIYAVSQLSESKTRSFGDQYMNIDKNLDGTISIEDLTEYLFENERFQGKQQTEYFFNQLSLSQRGYISYTQYLACVLSYRQYPKLRRIESENLQQDDQFDERFTFNCKISSIQESEINQHIELFNDEILYDFFLSLDKDKDGFISTKDFVSILQESNIIKQNGPLIKEIEYAFEVISNGSVKNNDCYEWTEDPRKFKRFLSRTYKGEKDGGTLIDFKSFKSWVRNPQKLLKKAIQ